ncbi:hypothetical protein SY83_02670 [Paenibacillus swuensis]|uniref:Uncharacterized protein n=1 Tax=Paenibacillus swuensis TaxID=1178515 RepID=A0A172TEP3_9BACL|nr:hypothetical protein [Paenibacillus swuensis]ANE45406.1 hypothetical protein SY83_02670 [Paenibacillus swuensis]
MFGNYKRLIERYREERIYISELVFSRLDEPHEFYLFLADFHCEIRVPVESVLSMKRIRSREETLYHISVSHGGDLLLIVDHNRGNHYIYCKRESYTRLLKHHNLGTDSIQTGALAWVAVSQEPVEANSNNFPSNEPVTENQVFQEEPTVSTGSASNRLPLPPRANRHSNDRMLSFRTATQYIQSFFTYFF